MRTTTEGADHGAEQPQDRWAVRTQPGGQDVKRTRRSNHHKFFVFRNISSMETSSSIQESNKPDFLFCKNLKQCHSGGPQRPTGQLWENGCRGEVTQVESDSRTSTGQGQNRSAPPATAGQKPRVPSVCGNRKRQVLAVEHGRSLRKAASSSLSAHTGEHPEPRGCLAASRLGGVRAEVSS